MKKNLILLVFSFSLQVQGQLPILKVSANRRYLQTTDGKPFFWMGDTGWFLFTKLNRAETVQYLSIRQAQGFNVIQVMVLPQLNAVNAYGDSALINGNIAAPKITEGNNPEDSIAYDYWDHIDWVVAEAEKRGIYIALVPIWGSNIKKPGLDDVKFYADFIANRYKNKSNIIWLNGGDINAAESFEKWNSIGNSIHAIDSNHLISFHPRGRTSSSDWFQHSAWLDFNMFQSGHKNYTQDTSSTEKRHYGEDNWKYVVDDYQLSPTRPVIDGEPSYEDIPYGLHSNEQPYWQDYEIRRYVYWSVFSGAFGFTYGHNAVMQFYTEKEKNGAFFPRVNWETGLKASGGNQMQFLKKLLSERSYFDRIPAQFLVTDDGEKYNKIMATMAKDYALFYTYNGRPFTIDLTKTNWKISDAFWFNPADGRKTFIEKGFVNSIIKYIPPGKTVNGNDWVLIIEKSKSR